MYQLKKIFRRFALAWALLLGLGGLAHAVDGVIEINQARALAGAVTPGDTPGFPVTISQPGSYRLTGNLTVPNANTTAIQVTADNVTIDLNGFAILGLTVCSGNPPTQPVTCAPLGAGIGVDALGKSSITVVNGTVRGMGNPGVRVGLNSRVEKVHAISNGNDGISAESGSTVTGNTARLNRLDGIHASGATVSGNTAISNGDDGIDALFGHESTVIGNTAVGNRGSGISASGTVSGNTANGNFENGISAFGAVSGNTASNNLSNGISTANSTVTGNTVNSNNFDGINATVGVGSTVLGNTAIGNSGFGLNLVSGSGYANNVLSNNKGGNAFPQVAGGINLGHNVCGGDTICP